MATRLVDDQNTALKIGFQATDWSIPISYADYTDVLQTWEVKAIVRNDTCIGAAYFKDGEVHVSVLPEWRRRWATRGVLAELFAHENAHTRIMPGHEYMYDIFDRLGFKARDDGALVKGN
jgi:hypothetical protein